MRVALPVVGAVVAVLGFQPIALPSAAGAQTPPPNIVIVLLDDAGFADLPPFGGRVPMPTLTSLAAGGAPYTHMRVCPLCSPTRAEILTGRYAHRVDVGDNGDRGKSGYRGRLDPAVPTLAERLRTAGYHTVMGGKWQLGSASGEWPHERGFDEDYVYAVEGGALFWWPPFDLPRTVVRNGTAVNPSTFPSGWFATDALVADVTTAITTHFAQASPAPLFAYVALNEPHFPLQAKPADIVTHLGSYDAGWESERDGAWLRQQQAGLWGTLSKPAPDARTIPYASMTAGQRAENAARMEVYAAQLTSADRAVGQIVTALDQAGALDDTLLVVLSDNGATNEWGPLGTTWSGTVAQVGTALFNGTYGGNWATASNVPFRGFKRDTFDGGLRSPMIVHWPNGIPQATHGVFRTIRARSFDLHATALEVAGVAPDPTLDGQSIASSFANPTAEILRPQFFECQGNKGVEFAGWKLVLTAANDLTLHYLPIDPGESIDWSNASAAHRWIRDQLAWMWVNWAAANRVSFVYPP